MLSIFKKKIGSLDFTYSKYKELCKTLVDSEINILTVKDYLSATERPDKFVIIRHDIDDESDLKYALQMAETENEYGFKTTYYFRICKNVFIEKHIKTINNLGHEIGYHYEVLGEAEGDFEKAIELFEKHLLKFRSICNISTIAQHGGPLRNCLNVVTISNIIDVIRNYIKGEQIFDHWESKDIWNYYSYQKYGIIGEPYLSIDFTEVAYISDTNRSWADSNYRLKDKIKAEENYLFLETTDDLINSIKKGEIEKLHMLIHPSNWKNTLLEWISWYLLQKVRNYGKRVLSILFSKRDKK
nr:hypothetical protein [uncultured Methanolobus sp.]